MDNELNDAHKFPEHFHQVASGKLHGEHGVTHAGLKHGSYQSSKWHLLYQLDDAIAPFRLVVKGSPQAAHDLESILHNRTFASDFKAGFVFDSDHWTSLDKTLKLNNRKLAEHILQLLT